MKPLTDKETEAFLLAADGLTIQEIADRLGVHRNSVKTRLESVKRKLGVERKRGLVLAAREWSAENRKAQ